MDATPYVPPEGRSRRRPDPDDFYIHEQARLDAERAAWRAEHDQNAAADRIIAERRAEIAKEIPLGKDTSRGE